MSEARASLRILHTESSLGWGGQEIRVLTEARGVARLRTRGHARGARRCAHLRAKPAPTA